MVGVRVEVVCPVCDNTEYVLRQGQYFCRMCNTQSQELGMETVMDDETIPLEVQGRKGGVTVGKNRRQRRKKRSLCNAVRWGTAEGYSWVLRGWVDQLKNIGVDVEIAVIQLWTLYLRKLKMGFEKMGEEGMLGSGNLKYREKWNMIGGPPGVLNNLTLAASKRRRMTLEEENSGDDMEYGEETLRERRIRNKKRRSFYKTVSNADSGSEMDPKSPSAPSSHGEGGISSGEVSEDEFSESGYITDPTLLSRVLERFVGNVTSNRTAFQHHKHLFQESKVKGAACLPTVLHMKQLAALVTLAVIGRTHSTLTMADMVAWFNSEGLAWKSALAFLPTAYSITTAEKMVFSGQQVIFTTNMMSVLVFRLASFLHQSPEKQIILVSPLTFKPILTRILDDLSLPSALCKDITNTFKHLHLLNMSATLQPYTPEKTGKLWARGGRGYGFLIDRFFL